ncbi:MAG: proline--tRNA ligase [Candidatus Nanoarchaeia archaeon]|nr:proline--tRNA ligase [Candidatus Nanoarchaeia archaeon]MDD5239335.1 proline--tRNA ligase [Candidatus Nanoarchaeia archaeon]
MADKEKLTQALQAKKANMDDWYPEVILKSELADYSKVSGCIVLRPYGYAIWEKIVAVVDEKLKKMGVKNCYFPLLIPESLLAKEQEHVKGFTPEVAWVTETGNSKLDEKLAIRPTSETIMYDSYSKWIQSWRDLPLKLNQWNNVVRWEFKHPKPFLRSREFLWNEGHTVFASEKEAIKDSQEVLDMYHNFVEEYMALAGAKVKKSENEKFAGAVYSMSVECMMPDGKMIQGPDSHFDGQKFAKAYDIKFLNKDGKMEHAWQNTFAISWRMIGVLVASHGDDRGLVLPPKLAPIPVVIVPIYKDDTKKEVMKKAEEISKEMKKFGVHLDDREEYTPGWKFNEWELKGVPLRIEIGPKDIEKKSVVLVRRDTGEKSFVKMSELKDKVPEVLDAIQKNLFEKSKKFLEERTKTAKTYAEMKKLVDGNRVLVDFCNEPACEEKVKGELSAKTTGIPLDDKFNAAKGTGKCIICGKPATCKAYFSKSY